MSDIEFAMSTYRRAAGRPGDERGIEAVWYLAYRCASEDAARRIVAEAKRKQALIDEPDTDAATISTLIDELEGLWTAIRLADRKTYEREQLAAGAGPFHSVEEMDSYLDSIPRRTAAEMRET